MSAPFESYQFRQFAQWLNSNTVHPRVAPASQFLKPAFEAYCHNIALTMCYGLNPATVAAYALVEGKDAETHTADFRKGAAFVENISLRVAAVSNGIQSIYRGFQIGVLTAFEVLAEEVWVGALNAHPKKLAYLSGRGGQQGGKQLALADIQKLSNGTCDLQCIMGLLLRGKYTWSARVDMRNAYRDAFGPTETGIISVVEDESIDVLDELRNIIVHGGGFADQDYIDKTATLKDAPRIVINTPWVPSGPQVVNLTSPVIEAGKTLLAAVDSWLVSN